MAESTATIIIRAKDDASGVIGAITESIRGLDHAVTDHVPHLSGFRDELDRIGKGILFGGALEAGRALFDGLGNAIGGAKQALFGVDSSLEQSAVKFTALTGSTDKARVLMGQLEEVAAHSTFGLQQIQQGAAQMLAFGARTENVVPLMKAVQTAATLAGGDINDKFTRINYVIAEMNSGIPVSARQLRQLAMAGVPLDGLAAQLGTTTDHLLEVGKTGEFTGKQVSAAFMAMYGEGGKFGSLMTDMTMTFSGAMAVIRTNVQLAIGQAFKPMFDLFRDGAVEVAKFVQTETFSRWVTTATMLTKALADALRSVASHIPLLETFRQLADGAQTSMASLDSAGALTMTNTGLKSSTTAAAELKAEIELGKEAVLGLDRQSADLTSTMEGLKYQAQDLKSSYEDQIEPLQKQLDVIKEQNNLEDKKADLLLKQENIRLRQAENNDQGLKGLKSELADLEEQRAKMGTAPIDRTLEREIAAAQEQLKNVTPGKAGDSQRAAIREHIDALREEQRQQRDNATDAKRALDAKINGVKEEIAAAEAGYKRQLDVNKAKQESLSLEMESRQVQKDIDALPLEEKIKGIKQAEADALEPITKQEQAKQRQIDTLKEERRQIELNMRAEQDRLKAIPKGAGGDGPDTGTPSGAQATVAGVNPAVAKAAGERFAKTLIEGAETYVKGHLGTIIGGAIGGVIGSALLGPIGGVAGALLGKHIGSGLNDELGKVNWGETFKDVRAAADRFGQFLKTDVLPHVKEFFGWLKENVPPAIQRVSAVFKTDIQPVLEKFGNWLKTDGLPALRDFAGGAKMFVEDQLLPAFRKIVTDVIPLVQKFAADLGEVIGNISQVIHDHGKGIQETITVAWNAIVFATGVLIDWWKFLADAAAAAAELILDAIGWVRDFIQWVFPKIGDLFDWLGSVAHGFQRDLSAGMQQMRDDLGRLHQWFDDKIHAVGHFFEWLGTTIQDWKNRGVEAIHTIQDTLQPLWQKAKDFLDPIRRFFDDIRNAISGVLGPLDSFISGLGRAGGHAVDFLVGHHAVGGTITTPLALVGEQGPEIIAAPGYHVYTAQQTAGLMHQGGHTDITYVTVNVSGSVTSEGQLVETIYTGLLRKKRQGIPSLGLS